MPNVRIAVVQGEVGNHSTPQHAAPHFGIAAVDSSLPQGTAENAQGFETMKKASGTGGPGDGPFKRMGHRIDSGPSSEMWRQAHDQLGVQHRLRKHQFLAPEPEFAPSGVKTTEVRVQAGLSAIAMPWMRLSIFLHPCAIGLSHRRQFEPQLQSHQCSADLVSAQDRGNGLYDTLSQLLFRNYIQKGQAPRLTRRLEMLVRETKPRV
ncbi:hypothetical protein GCM10007385_39230 [Tateyamaria omphalii]|nr:hypothetical protein GCM10007385_39230 [Tateyamaria omphalii]